MKKLLLKRHLDWEPIKNPILQNTLLGFVVGVVLGINVKIIFEKINVPAFIWNCFFLFGLVAGFLSGIERSRLKKRKAAKAQTV